VLNVNSKNDFAASANLMAHHGKTSVLFVCMGNICRSPTAEGVLRKMVGDAGMQDRVFIDSCGTHDYHVGAPPDSRAQAAALRRGYDLSSLRARQIAEADFEDFDLLLAMDTNNLGLLQCMCPLKHRSKVRLLMNYASGFKSPIVPDPYYRGSNDFDMVLDYIESACRGLVTILSHSNAAIRQA
jgi:protein-tyrosine phosphatase